MNLGEVIVAFFQTVPGMLTGGATLLGAIATALKILEKLRKSQHDLQKQNTKFENHLLGELEKERGYSTKLLDQLAMKEQQHADCNERLRTLEVSDREKMAIINRLDGQVQLFLKAPWPKQVPPHLPPDHAHIQTNPGS